MKKKRIVSFMLGLMLAFTGLPTSAASVQDFKDVPQSAWYYAAVKSTVEEGLFAGVSKDIFDPGGTMTRAMFVQTLANRTDNYDPQSQTNNIYGDVADNAWFCKAVNWGYGQNIIYGVSEGLFAPYDAITREQAVIILYRYVMRIGGDTTIQGTTLDSFADSDSVSYWAEKYMQWAVNHGVISGVGGNRLDPQGYLTRAQAAQVYMNAKSLLTSRTIYAPGGIAEDPQFDSLRALNMTYKELVKNTAMPKPYVMNYGGEGSYYFDFDDFKDITCAFSYGDDVFNWNTGYPYANAKPAAVVTNIKNLYPELVGMNYGEAVKATDGILQIYYESESGRTLGYYYTKSYYMWFDISSGGVYLDTIPASTEISVLLYPQT